MTSKNKVFLKCPKKNNYCPFQYILPTIGSLIICVFITLHRHCKKTL